MANHGDHPPFEYSRIDDQILVGTNACCTEHFKMELIDKGVRADVSMEAERLDMAAGAEYFLWLPTEDHTAPTLKKLQVGAAAIVELVNAGEQVYIHCRNGHGRGPTMAAAYYVSTGLGVEAAIAKVAAARPETHIEPNQHKRLEEFEEWARGR